MSENIRAGNGRALQRATLGPSRITDIRQRRFLDTLAATCNVRMAAEAAGAATTSFYALRRRDAVFAEAWQAAIAIGYHRLEEAMLDYALARFEIEAIDPDRADPQAAAAGIACKLVERRVSAEDLRFALSLLGRHRATAEGRAVNARGGRRATAEETDAALLKQLDMLAQQMIRHGV